jgi:hypothetical protein
MQGLATNLKIVLNVLNVNLFRIFITDLVLISQILRNNLENHISMLVFIEVLTFSLAVL